MKNSEETSNKKDSTNHPPTQTHSATTSIANFVTPLSHHPHASTGSAVQDVMDFFTVKPLQPKPNPQVNQSSPSTNPLSLQTLPPQRKRSRSLRQSLNGSVDENIIPIKLQAKIPSITKNYPPVPVNKETNAPSTSKGGTNDQASPSDGQLWDQGDLLWVNENLPQSRIFPEHSLPPYVLLLESTVAGRNVRKYDPISLIDLLSPFIVGNKTITRNGKNQVKIFCEDRNSANSLITSRSLIQAGFKVFILDSFLSKKGFTTWFPFSRTIMDIVRLCSSEYLRGISCIRRKVDEENTIYDKVEFTFGEPTVPRNIKIGDYHSNHSLNSSSSTLLSVPEILPHN